MLWATVEYIRARYAYTDSSSCVMWTVMGCRCIHVNCEIGVLPLLYCVCRLPDGILTPMYNTLNISLKRGRWFVHGKYSRIQYSEWRESTLTQRAATRLIKLFISEMWIHTGWYKNITQVVSVSRRMRGVRFISQTSGLGQVEMQFPAQLKRWDRHHV